MNRLKRSFWIIYNFKEVFALQARRAFPLIFLLLLSSSAHAALFSSVRSGNFHSPCTWSNASGCPSRPPAAIVGVNIPGPSDQVLISNRHTVDVRADATVAMLTIDNGTGSSATTLNVAGDITFSITGDLIIDRHGNISISGGAFVNVGGNACVKNNGNIAVNGTGAAAGNYFYIRGCSSTGGGVAL